MDNLEKNSSDNIEHLKKIYFWRSAFFGLVILTAGIVIGGASMSIFASHNIGSSPPPRQYGNLIPRLTRTLGLTQQQIDKIKPILDKNMQKLWDIREDARIDIVNTLDQMNKEIAPILAENQKLVWSNELLRIQRDVSPEPLRNNAAGNRRGGAAQPGQGQRRMGNVRGQPPRGSILQRRAMEPLPSPNTPNSISSEVNTEENITNKADSNSIE
jgi:hypothetical protein